MRVQKSGNLSPSDSKNPRTKVRRNSKIRQQQAAGYKGNLEILSAGGQQILFRGEHQSRINSPIITTGNELQKEEIGTFSRQLSIGALYDYIADVDAASTQILKSLTYSDLKATVSGDSRKQLELLRVVSTDENAYWLMDYWCGKDVKGLIRMPFSRHWIMHIEACLRIRDKLLSK